MGQVEEDLLETAPFVNELVQDDLVLGGQRAEPFGRGPVDDQGVRGDLAIGHRHGLQYGDQPGQLGCADAQTGRRPGLGGQVGQRRLEDELPVGDDDHVVDGLLHLGEEVGRDQHRVSDRGLMADERAQPLDALGVEPVRGLVEDQDLRVPEKGGGQLEALPHPQGELAHPASGNVREPDQRQRLVHPRPGQSRTDGHHPQVVLCPAARVEAGRLEDGAHVVDGMVQIDVAAPAEGGSATGDRDQAEQHAQRGGLSRTVRPEESGHPARSHLETEVVDGAHCSELLGQRPYLDGRWHVRRYPARSVESGHTPSIG